MRNQRKKTSGNPAKSYYYSRQQRARLVRLQKVGIVLLVLVIAVVGVLKIVRPGFLSGGKYWELSDDEITAEKPDIDVQLLDVNDYSRPGTESGEITGIVIHYTANPGATAQNNRDYFEGLKDSHITQASSHFIVGLDGEIIQCVPTWEVAYASNSRNYDTVSIECCHPDETGAFTAETYRSVVQLTAWLCEKFGLDSEDVIRHYDITGKDCPRYFVEHEDAWEIFKENVQKSLDAAS